MTSQQAQPVTQASNPSSATNPSSETAYRHHAPTTISVRGARVHNLKNIDVEVRATNSS